MIQQARFFLERVNFGRQISIHVLCTDQQGRQSRMLPVTFEVMPDDYAAIHDPALQLPFSDAQSLMDELWTVGLRPSQGHATEGQQGATTKHLEDMRAMVAKLAGVPLP